MQTGLRDLSRPLQVHDARGPAEEFFESVADFRSSVFVSVQDNAITLRVDGDKSHLLPHGDAQLQLLEGPRARLRHRYDGKPVTGSITVKVDYAMEDQASLPAPTIETWGVLGSSCPSSSEGPEGRDGRIAVAIDDAIAWSGLYWDIVSAPADIQDQFMQYIDEVNLRMVSPRTWHKLCSLSVLTVS